MSPKLHVRLFRAERWIESGAGTVPGAEALDRQVNAWVDRTGHRIVSVSTPGLYRAWSDPQQTTLHEIETLVVLYSRNPNLPCDED